MIKLTTTWPGTVNENGETIYEADGLRDYQDADWCNGMDWTGFNDDTRDAWVLTVTPKDEAQRQAILADSRFTIVES